ncbi:MAG: hypothetical protein H7Z75_10050 [Ferruginibacter sp.]|nr:hypothetical protein [Cytophagales bacterium]
MKKMNSIFGHPTRSGMLAVALCVGFSSCQEREVVPATEEKPEAITLTDYLVATTGFAAEAIAYDAEKQTFVIDEDILVAEADVRRRLKSARGGRTEQWRWDYLVANAYVTNIDYYFESNVPSSWKRATRLGIDNWNAINDTKLFLRETTNRSQADVVVRTDYADANWIAQAYLPLSDGKPGDEITINTKYNSLIDSKKIFAMTHEMGHTFGLAHTNQTWGVFISGTPSSDPNSVMKASVLAWNGFTGGDTKAVRTLYPR